MKMERTVIKPTGLVIRGSPEIETNRGRRSMMPAAQARAGDSSEKM